MAEGWLGLKILHKHTWKGRREEVMMFLNAFSQRIGGRSCWALKASKQASKQTNKKTVIKLFYVHEHTCVRVCICWVARMNERIECFSSSSSFHLCLSLPLFYAHTLLLWPPPHLFLTHSVCACVHARARERGWAWSALSFLRFLSFLKKCISADRVCHLRRRS